MSAEECNNAYVHMIAHIDRRNGATKMKPARFAGFVIRSQPMLEDVERAADRVGGIP